MNLKGFCSKIRFSNPEPNQVVILYSQDHWIKELILKEIKSTTLELYPVCVHVTLVLAARLLFRIRHIEFFVTPRAFFLKNFLRQLYAQYVLSCIDQTRARVVLTNIDNSSFFQYLSRIDKDRTYFAIQNGTRTLFCVRDSLPEAPHPFAKISMPNFFCFGNRDVQLFSRFGHQIDKFYPIGSLIGGYFKSVLSSSTVTPRFDLCLISQWHDHLLGEATVDGLDSDITNRVSAGIRGLNEYLSRLLDETDLSLVVCPRNDDREELAFYENLFQGRATIATADRIDFSTYRVAEQSRLIVGLNSTVLSEFFAWGKKVLWCNVPSDEHYAMPEAGISYFHGDNYAAFKERVLSLLAMKPCEYEQKTEAGARFINNFDPAQPPHELIRSTILQVLSRTT